MIIPPPTLSSIHNDFYTAMIEESSFKKEENKILIGFIISLLSMVVLTLIYLDYGVPFIKSTSSNGEQVLSPKEYPRYSVNT